MYPGAPGYGGGYGAYPGAAYPGAYPGAPPTGGNPLAASSPNPTHAMLQQNEQTNSYYASYGTPPPVLSHSSSSTTSATVTPTQPHAVLTSTASVPVLLPSQQPFHPVGVEKTKPRKEAVARRDFKIIENAKDHHAWMVKQEDFVHYDVTDRFRDVFHDVVGPLWRVPEEARNYRYILIPGLFTNSYPGYMEGVIKHLRQKQFDVIKAPIDTGGTVLRNAEDIAKMVERDDSRKQIVLMGHSKGGVDLTAALCMYPHIQSRIRAVVCLQSPHAGTPIPSDILDGGVVSFVTGVVKPFDPAALRDLSYQSRIAFWKEYDYPEKIPTLNLVTFCKKAFAVMSMTHKHILTKYSSPNDGLVPLHDGLIPRTASILLGGLDHGAPVFEMQADRVYKPGPLFECLITCVLELPPSFSEKLCTPLQQTPPPPQKGEVHLYSKPNFGGQYVRLKRPEVGDLKQYGLKSIRSVKVGPQTVAEFMPKEQCLGTPVMTLDATAASVADMKDRLKSLRITCKM